MLQIDSLLVDYTSTVSLSFVIPFLLFPSTLWCLLLYNLLLNHSLIFMIMHMKMFFFIGLLSGGLASSVCLRLCGWEFVACKAHSGPRAAGFASF